MTTFERAARGDVTAQREMIIEAYAQGGAGVCTWRAATEWALFWARMTALRGGRGDREIFERVLLDCQVEACARGELDAMRDYSAELMAFLDDRADLGDDDAGERLTRMAHNVPVETMKQARALADMWKTRRQEAADTVVIAPVPPTPPPWTRSPYLPGAPRVSFG